MSLASVGAVLVASLLGSVHCMAMCGGFATVAATHAGRRATLAYQGGRLLGYLGLGAAAGLLGASVDRAAVSLVGLHHVATLLTGGALVVIGLAALAPRRAAMVPLVTLRQRPSVLGLGRRWWRAGLSRGGPLGAAAIGLGSALLPCGWLWGYVLVAASTAAVLPAVAVMFALWAGSLPALLSVGAVAGWLRRHLGPFAPRLVAALMVLMGVLALAGKLGPSLHAPPSEPAAHEAEPAAHQAPPGAPPVVPSCHEPS